MQGSKKDAAGNSAENKFYRGIYSNGKTGESKLRINGICGKAGSGTGNTARKDFSRL